MHRKGRYLSDNSCGFFYGQEEQVNTPTSFQNGNADLVSPSNMGVILQNNLKRVDSHIFRKISIDGQSQLFCFLSKAFDTVTTIFSTYQHLASLTLLFTGYYHLLKASISTDKKKISSHCSWCSPGLSSRPFPFLVYILHFGQIIWWHALRFHCYFLSL